MTSTQQRFFVARPVSVGQAREFVDRVLAEWGRRGRVGDVRVCVSELATNALVHGAASGGFLVRVGLDGDVVRLEVHDSGGGLPVVRAPVDTDATGRGLLLVAAFSDEWGVELREPFGKIVWSQFKIEPLEATR